MLLKMLLQSTFSDTPTIIFLNKKDLLRKKIAEGADPTKHFPLLERFRSKKHKAPVSFSGVPLSAEEVDLRYNYYFLEQSFFPLLVPSYVPSFPQI